MVQSNPPDPLNVNHFNDYLGPVLVAQEITGTSSCLYLIFSSDCEKHEVVRSGVIHVIIATVGECGGADEFKNPVTDPIEMTY